MTLTPFDFVKDLSHKKTNILTDETESFYVPFIINRAFSLFDDCLYHSNLINQYSHLDKKLQHDYYLHALRSKSRFKKWPWKKQEHNETIDLICMVYKYSRKKAEQIIRILSKEQIEYLKKQQEKGGVINDRKLNRNSTL